MSEVQYTKRFWTPPQNDVINRIIEEHMAHQVHWHCLKVRINKMYKPLNQMPYE